MESRLTTDVEAGPAELTILGSAANETSVVLVYELGTRGIRAALASAGDALGMLRTVDRVLARLDVLPTLDGIEPGLLALLRLERRGVRVINRSAALLAVHDKLRTARLLEAAGLPHPRTTSIPPGGDIPGWSNPFVLKPRFGSWGRDVFRCSDREEGRGALATISERAWFRRHGALVQELLPAGGRDLRVIVAGNEVIGAAVRVAAPGEWRTNVSLGGTLELVDPPPGARTLARAAAAATGADLVGVDLLPVGSGYVVLELNGAVDFDNRYSIRGRDVYDELIGAFGFRERAENRSRLVTSDQ
jgi:RimK family alpha-L-glutamate ligase